MILLPPSNMLALLLGSLATRSPWLSTLSTGGIRHLFRRLNLTDRGSCNDTPVPTPTTLLSQRLLCGSPSRQSQRPSRLLILSQACPPNHQKCHWIQYGHLTIPQHSEWVGTHVPVLRQMQIKDQLITDGPRRGTHLLECARIRTSSQSFVQRLVSFKIHALTVLFFIGSVAEPDAASI